MGKNELKLNKNGKTGTLIIGDKIKVKCRLEYDWDDDFNEDIWEVYTYAKGSYYFTFDKKRVFNMWADYPYKLTKKQIKIFDKATNGFWHKFFRNRFYSKKQNTDRNKIIKKNSSKSSKCSAKKSIKKSKNKKGCL